jgi:quercetin dioxygenase-like cupin family protein
MTEGMQMKRIIIAAVAVFVVTGGIAAATPSRGWKPQALGATTVDSLSITPDGPSVALFVRVAIEPDGTSGWHSHPSHVFVLVRRGHVAVFNGDDCSRTVYNTGDVFTEMPGHVHKAKNIGDDEAVLIATFVGLPPDTPPTTDEENPCD